jgi:DNA (cytosine-5)-methyltransferase 1
MGSDRPATAKPRVVELFAGVGGFRLGMEANGFETVWANQWEPGAVTQHAWDAYVTRFYAGDHAAAPENGNDDIERVMDLAEKGEFEIPDHDVLVGGFPCFTAGTAILTESGYRPIEQLAVGDRVLTHLGRWRRVTAVMSREAESTLVIRGQGFPDIRTTDEHPFWARRRGHRWDNVERRDVRTFDEPRWIEAGQMDRSTFVSQVYPAEHPAPPVDTKQAPAFYWLVGRYLADGWRVTANGKGRVVIAAGAHEADEVERRIRAVYPCTPARERTVVKFHITRAEFHGWLADFGHGAAGKRIPAWLYGIDRDQAAALLDGYATGDGHPWQEGWKATTVSRSLALGLALLVQKAFGVVASIHEAPVPAATTIEGRVVGQQKQYQLVVPPRNRSAFIEGDYGWKLVRSVKSAPGATVYNISVEEDESYVADGCVVHNCQDYSVAKTLNQALGLEGKKGVLWWQIHRILTMKRPRFFFLENVDRLLKSPASQRGRDFAIMLATLGNLGYEVEWRMVNAADYGFPQKRRRVYIVGRLAGPEPRDPAEVVYSGTIGRALPVQPSAVLESLVPFKLRGDAADLTKDFDPRQFNGKGDESPFRNAGYFSHRLVWSLDLKPDYDGPFTTLGDILDPEDEVPESYFVPESQLDRWQYLKGAKDEARVHKGSGTPYRYQEGGLPFPDPVGGPARTILTAEGGATPSRFKHIIQTPSGRYRRLTPRELEMLNGFPPDWTATGMPEGRRAFMMGNALVVGVVERIADELKAEIGET